MNTEKSWVIPADHPSLTGHFPGHPIVPGVVILDEVIHAFNAERPDVPVMGIPVVKFLAPLHSEQPFSIRFTETRTRRIRFECVRADGQLLAQGQLALRPE